MAILLRSTNFTLNFAGLKDNVHFIRRMLYRSPKSRRTGNTLQIHGTFEQNFTKCYCPGTDCSVHGKVCKTSVYKHGKVCTCLCNNTFMPIYT